jgi:hypothetical protein
MRRQRPVNEENNDALLVVLGFLLMDIFVLYCRFSLFFSLETITKIKQQQWAHDQV